MNAIARHPLVEDALAGSVSAEPDLVGAIVSLTDLGPGQRGTIVSVASRFGASRRLLALGFAPGSEVTVRRAAPLRDPVEYSVRGASVSLRRREASWIFVRVDAR